MKKVVVALALSAVNVTLFAQVDSSTKKDTPIIKIGNMTILHSNPKELNDTIKTGKFTIIGKGISQKGGMNVEVKKNSTPAKVRTNWFVWDLGFSGYSDKTNYAIAAAQNFLHNQGIIPASAGDYALKTTRVSNFNFWFFMQTLNLSKGVLNMKYGFGIESNNYFYKTGITYVDGLNTYTVRGTQNGLNKNKLVASYLTVPVMLNINTNPGKKKSGLQISAGVSGGYLQRARQKQVSSDGTVKNKSNFNLEPWKLAYIGELGLGPIKLYGSIATTKLHQYGLEQMPYTVGVRFSN